MLALVSETSWAGFFFVLVEVVPNNGMEFAYPGVRLGHGLGGRYL